MMDMSEKKKMAMMILLVGGKSWSNIKVKVTGPWRAHPHPQQGGAVEAEEGTRKLTERSAPEEKFRCKPVLGNQRLNLVVS